MNHKMTRAKLLCTGLGVAGLMIAGLTVDGAGTPAKAAGTVINVKNQVLSLETNKGMLIRLPQQANSVFVAAPGIADVQVKSPSLIYIFGLAAGETTLYATDANDNVIFSTRVRVEQDLATIYDMIKQVAPTSNVTIRPAGGNVILSGNAESPAEADMVERVVEGMYAPTGSGQPLKIINQISVMTPTQVNLRVKFAEVGSDVLKQLGVQWDAARQFGKFTLGTRSAGSDFVNSNGTLTIPSSSAAIGGLFQDAKTSVAGLLTALQNGGHLHILAEPNLTAMSGEQASFLAGGEFPVPVPQGINGAIGIEYRPFGVKLDFVPVVITSDRVTLRVRPEVSELSAAGAITIQGFSVPAVSTRRVETTVELGSGETFALAGLLQNSVSQDNSKTPFLGDIPVLGALFKSESYRRRETELVVLVTPYIVKPVSNPSDVMLPTDGLIPPSDKDRILHNQTFKPQPAPQSMAPKPKTGATPSAAGKGGAGFELD